MRPILIASVGYIVGIIWELYLKTSVALFLCIIIIICIALLCIYYKKIKNDKIIKRKINRYLKVFKNKNNLKQITIFTTFFLLSIIYIKILDMSYETKYNALKNKEISFVCTVVSDKKESKYQDTYTVKVEYAYNENKKMKINMNTFIRLKKQKSSLNYGDKIICKGEFEKATPRTNYKGYSYEESLKAKSIYGIINTSYENVKIVKANNINIISRLANKSKITIIENVNAILPKDTKDLVLGFLLGYTDEMEENIKEAFRNSSLSHMLAVSGAHVSYIILGISFALNKIKLDKKLAKIFTILILIFFMFLTNFTPSVTRACIMGICILISGVFYIQTDFSNSISLALLIILIYNPFSIYNIGLQLSFGGTIGIVLFSKNISNLIDSIWHKYIEKQNIENKNITNNKSLKNYLHKIFKIIKEMLAVTVSAQIMIIPITILNFNTISLTFFISNILASPFMGLITIGGFLLAFVSIMSIKISAILAKIYNLPLKLLIFIVQFCGRLPGSKIYVITISGVTVLIYYFVIFYLNYYYTISIKIHKSSFEKLIIKLYKNINKLIIKNKKKIIKNIVIIVILIICITVFTRKIKGLQIYLVDVGQGDCTLIITPNNKRIIIDGGGSNTSNSSYDVGESVVFPYLLDRKIASLDYVIISHFDSDHYKGLEFVLKNMKVRTAIIPKQFEECDNYNEFIKIAKNKRIKVVEVMAGDKVKIDKDVYIYVLWPTEDEIKENSINNNSIVCKIYYNNFSALFTGDIEEEAEKEILSKYENVKINGINILGSDLLKVAHHGSKSSSIEEFVEVIKPKICLIGVGKYNTFGHPNIGVIERLKKIGAKVLRTDEDGECKVVVSSNGRIKLQNCK